MLFRDYVRNISYNNTLPWLFMGDFNDMLGFEEKFWGNLVIQTKIREFKSMLDDSNLIDLGFEGPCFTWCDKHDSGPFILERLDRAFCNWA